LEETVEESDPRLISRECCGQSRVLLTGSLRSSSLVPDFHTDVLQYVNGHDFFILW
jgi:hypothetical protein